MKLEIESLREGDRFDLGIIRLSEEEIISFAKAFDPLEFHIDREAAKRTIFKGLIASGPHIFTLIHKKEWIPRFGYSVIAGVEVNNWKFLRPVYPEMPVSCFVEILSIKPNPEKRLKAIKWKYVFLDEKQEEVQVLDMVVLHRVA